jgi:hydroxymethylpyrimidine/phosphomethylpyrimidine kinase
MLTIAGFDPSSGAGVTADLMVFASHGCFGTACVTALTVQSTVGVRASEPVSAEIVAATLACLEGDLPVDGVKIGMLATAENVLAVSRFVERVRARHSHVPVVLDPVLRSTSGRELLSAAGLDALRATLLPMVDWVTPNLAELEILTGIPAIKPGDMEVGARVLLERYRTLGIVVKGGHLAEGAHDLVLEPSGRLTWLGGERVQSRSTHGTGCAFSSALACGLAQGRAARDAARAAKDYVRGAMGHATPVGAGTGPMNLLWHLQK